MQINSYMQRILKNLLIRFDMTRFIRNHFGIIILLSVPILIWTNHDISTYAAKKTYSFTCTFTKNKTKNYKGTLTVDEAFKITVKNGTKKISYSQLSFKTNNKKIATVSKKGVITAKKAGSCKITIKRKGKKDTIVLKLTVKKKPSSKIAVTGISISGSYYNDIYVGDSFKLQAVIYPYNATNKSIRWSSDDNAVASVSQDGVVTGVGSGYAYITATTVEGNYSDACKVTVSPIEVNSIDIAEEHITLYLGNTKQLAVLISPGNATDKSVIWTSSDTSVATVSSTGVVTAVGYGSCAITAKSGSNNYKSDTCSITVPEYVVKDGQCGEKISYHLEGYRGDIVLTISGTGDMYSSFKTGWEDYASDIKTIKMSNGITSIKPDAFKNFDKLISVELPQTLTNIGSYAFYYCSKLENINFPDALTSIGACAFSNSGIKNVEIKSNINKLGSSAFSNCDGLTSVVIPDNNGLRYENTFSDCSNIHTAHIYSNNTYDVLYLCSKIETIYVMQGVTDVSINANKVKKLYLPLSIQSIYQTAEEFFYPGSESDFKKRLGSGNLSEAIPHFNYNW